ncbi:IS630-Spn1, transposase Orf1 [Wolbachia endosymbiont of Armadillidium vulgare str. wVulC]|nr:IS630-Spn1, transposase Orf1 [Wolbachia endosymbiont of Armadillidium vulgare str. wVulC]
MKERVEPKRFKIGKTTLYEWKKRREKTEDFQSKKPGSMA